MTDLGEMKRFLGIEVTRDRKARTIRLNQERYVDEVLQRFGMENCKPMKTPLPTRPNLEVYAEDANVENCKGPKMIRSHVLLHCANPRLRAAREEAWENKNPGSIRVLLSNPRWERRLLRPLEMSGVGRVVGDGTDEDQARAERMDYWIAWEAEERMEARGDG